MKLILPTGRAAEAQLAGLAGARLAAFDQRSLAFLADFSERILADPTLRPYPELIALGYWFRPAAIARLHQRYRGIAGSRVVRPRGIVLHFAPANVDTLFAYSWFIALLCGNRNIVRLSARQSPAQERLLSLLADLLAAPRHEAVAAASAVLGYAHDDAISTDLSSRCQLRVVWGGDETVQHIRRLPLSPLATELVFANRYSWTLLFAPAVLAVPEDGLARLAAAFCNDAFWFDQQACASPRSVLWIGDDEVIAAAQGRFWAAVGGELAARGMQSQPAQLMGRITAAYLMAASGASAPALDGVAAWPLRLAVDRFDASLREAHCGHGLFCELRREHLDDSADLFSPVDQTVGYWGLERAELLGWIDRLADGAVDQVVPVGQALNFDDVWDGHDLLMAFSRVLVLR